MAFGLHTTNKHDRYPIILRNWLTFSLRHSILLEEHKAFKINESSDSNFLPSYEKFFASFNYRATQELKTKELLYDFQGLKEKFRKIVTVGNAVACLTDEELKWNELL